MSTDRLTADERATYLIGQAFRRIMDADPASFPEAIRAQAWGAYAEVLPAALTPEEVDSVMTTTGLVGEGWLDMPAEPAPGLHYVMVPIDATTAAPLLALAERCTDIHRQRDAGVTSHGELTVPALLAMLAEDAGLAFSHPGSWQGDNMRHVLACHGYRFPLFDKATTPAASPSPTEI